MKLAGDFFTCLSQQTFHFDSIRGGRLKAGVGVGEFRGGAGIHSATAVHHNWHYPSFSSHQNVYESYYQKHLVSAPLIRRRGCFYAFYIRIPLLKNGEAGGDFVVVGGASMECGFG